MLKNVCTAKIANASVTHLLVDYEGSLGISSEIVREAAITPGEMVLVVNTANSNRFETYIIEEKERGRIALYGGAAKLAKIGDKLIIMSFASLNGDELRSFKGPKVVKLTESNNF